MAKTNLNYYKMVNDRRGKEHERGIRKLLEVLSQRWNMWYSLSVEVQDSMLIIVRVLACLCKSVGRLGVVLLNEMEMI